jgi:hypothetical protein
MYKKNYNYIFKRKKNKNKLYVLLLYSWFGYLNIYCEVYDIYIIIDLINIIIFGKYLNFASCLFYCF